MMSTAIPARLEFQCGHAALVSLPRIKGESSAQRNERVAREKTAAQARHCDFCAPRLEVIVQAMAPPPLAVEEPVAVSTTVPVTAAAEPPTPVAVTVTAPPVAVTPEPVTPIAPPPPPAPVVAAAEPPPPAPVVKAPRVSRPRVAAPPPLPTPVAAPTEPPAAARRARTAKLVVATPVTVSPPTPAAPAPGRLVASKPRRDTPVRRRLQALSPSTPASNGASAATRTRYAVSFQLERVLVARDIRDALRKAEALGAAEVVAITRES